MSQPGMGAMIHYLSGGSDNDPAKYIGKTIKSARLDGENEKLRIEFSDGVKIAIWDDGQS